MVSLQLDVLMLRLVLRARCSFTRVDPDEGTRQDSTVRQSEHDQCQEQVCLAGKGAELLPRFLPAMRVVYQPKFSGHPRLAIRSSKFNSTRMAYITSTYKNDYLTGKAHVGNTSIPKPASSVIVMLQTRPALRRSPGLPSAVVLCAQQCCACKLSECRYSTQCLDPATILMIFASLPTRCRQAALPIISRFELIP